MGAWDHTEPLSHCYLAQAPLVFDVGWRIRSGSYSLLGKDLHHWYTLDCVCTLCIGTLLDCGAHILLAVAVRKQVGAAPGSHAKR